MKILFVINNLYIRGNGLSASARRTIHELKAAGEDVRVLTGCNPDKPGQHPDFPLKEFKFPIFQPIIDANGYSYAKSDNKRIEEAVRWAEVIHLEEMFVLQYKTIRIARRLGKPMTASFHLFPENILNNLGIKRWQWPNQVLLHAWQKYIYYACSHIQCPTELVRKRLQENGYTSELRVISNGLIPETCLRPANPPKDYLDPERPLEVICIGRLANEKDQITLIRAMRHCQHAKRIHLVFAGNGPLAGKLKKKASQLYRDGIVSYEPSFVFLNHDELCRLAAKADLTVHCAYIEIEGLSILEAMQQGAVPVIAEGPLTGSAQFALSERSLFPIHDAQALAERIDDWLSHPEERWEEGKRYAASVKQYAIATSVEQMIDMFRDALKQSKHVEETA